MANTLNLSLTDELRAFIDENCGDGTLYATPSEFVRDLLRQRKLQLEAAKARDAILEGYQDAIDGRTFTFDGNLRSLLKKGWQVIPRAKSNLLLTQRALSDLATIREYSTKQWGEKTAEKYLDDLQAGLRRIREQPDILKEVPELHPALKFYRVNKHLFACDTQSGSIVVLTVMHASMDIPSRLAELQPTIAAEVELLHRKLRQAQRSKSH